MVRIIITPMASPVPRQPAGARPAEAPQDQGPPQNRQNQHDRPEIDGLLGPLLPRERGFVLGLLLSRGVQEQREDTARVVSGPSGDRCADAIRQANALSREGRLSLIRRLAGEVLGTGTEGLDVFAFPDGRLAQALARESTEILRIMATPATPAAMATPTSTDSLILAATRELERRPPELPPSTWAPARDDLIEIRRALLARLRSDTVDLAADPADLASPGGAAGPAAPQPPPGAPPGPRRRRPPDPNL
jgi:hypothetical protein